MEKILPAKPIGRARSAVFPLRLTDADVVLLFAFAFLAFGGFQRFTDAYAQSVFQAFASMFNTSELLALLAIYSVCKSELHSIVLSKFDFEVIAACALSLLLPNLSLPFIGTTAAGLYFWCRSPKDVQLASVGQLLLAISCYELWGRLFFNIVSAPIIQAEVSVVSKFGQWLGYNLGLDGILLVSPNGWSIFMMEDCSSFHNISLTVLVWLSLIKLGGAKATGLTVMALCAGITGIICLNGLRILLMTPSEEAYQFWHNGNGAIIFSCVTLAVIAFPTTASMRLRDV
jgi:hypothetical protein